MTVDNAINIIKQLGPGSKLCKTDVADAFKQIPIAKSLWPFHGIKWNNLTYYFCRLVFGSRSSPYLFDQLALAICWIASHVFGISHIIHLLDDFLSIDAPDYPAERTMALISMLFTSLNIPTALHKTIGPTTCLEFLGIILDTVLMEARLPA